MKKTLWLPVALITGLALFAGCQKSIEESMDSSVTRNPRRLAGDAPISLTQSPDPGVVNQQVTVTAAFDALALICGKAKFQQYNTVTLDWDDVTGFINFNGGPITYNFIPTQTSTNIDEIYKFRISYAPGTGQDADKCPGGTYNGGPSTAIDVVVVDASCSIDGYAFTGTVLNCAQTGRSVEYEFGSEDGVGYFKMQGGLNNFTGDNATVYINGTLVDFNGISDDGWAQGTVGGFTIGQRTPGESTNRNIRVEGSLGECAGVKVRIVWNTTNGGNTLTGSWSVKDNGGVDLAPPLADLFCN